MCEVARMSKPARKLTKSAVKNIVRFPSIKSNGGQNILVESILESKYCLHLEFDPKVKSYRPQPKTFIITSDDQDITYTPDFEVTYFSGEKVYIEVKPLEIAKSYYYQDLFEYFELYLQDSNESFQVVDETYIFQEPLLSNFEKLYQFRKRVSLDMGLLHNLASEISFELPLSDLIKRLESKTSLREIYSWIALGYLCFDMNEEELTKSTRVKFYV